MIKKTAVDYDNEKDDRDFNYAMLFTAICVLALIGVAYIIRDLLPFVKQGLQVWLGCGL